MNRVRVYVKIFGPSFDAEAFQRAIGSKHGGQVRVTQRIQDGSVEVSGRYWRSKIVEVGYAEDPGEALFQLLSEIEAILVGVAKEPSTCVTAEVVEEIDDLEALVGFYFSRDLIRLLARISADIDVDIVRRLVQSKRSRRAAT